MRIYVSGPMTGMPHLNRESFDDACNDLLVDGHIPVNPYIECSALSEQCARGDYMWVDLKALLDCDAIKMLPGWEKSWEAVLEHTIAMAVKMDILY